MVSRTSVKGLDLSFARPPLASTGQAMGSVLSADACWLRPCPEFKILRSVIIPTTIHVMHLFAGLQVASNRFFHHKAMLKNPRPLVGTWFSRGIRMASWGRHIGVALCIQPSVFMASLHRVAMLQPAPV